jgi:hypothetical protein
MKLSLHINVLNSSEAISHVSVELKMNSEIFSVTIMQVNVVESNMSLISVESMPLGILYSRVEQYVGMWSFT